MNKLRQDTLLYLLEFFDIKTLISCCSTCKKFHKILEGDYFWKHWIKIPKIKNIHHSGIYFSYKEYSYIKHYLWTNEPLEQIPTLIKALSSSISVPSLLTPSNKYIAYLSNSDILQTGRISRRLQMMNSLMNVTNLQEPIIYEFEEKSVIYGVHIEINIIGSLESEENLYNLVRISLDYKVIEKFVSFYPANTYHSFLALPEIVIAQRVIIQILDSTIGNESFHMLKGIWVTGFPLSVLLLDLPRKDLEIAFKSDHERNLKEITPHKVGLLESLDILESVVNIGYERDNLNYLGFFVYLLNNLYYPAEIRSCVNRMVMKKSLMYVSLEHGDLLFEESMFELAADVYYIVGARLELMKTAIKLRRFHQFFNEYHHLSPGEPPLSVEDAKDLALSFGPDYLKELNYFLTNNPSFLRKLT